MIENSYCFDDVLIVPSFSKISSRKEVDISTNVNNLNLSLPIISANMDTVTGNKMANAMQQSGGVGCLHRFMSIEDNVKEFLDSPKSTIVSIGIGKGELERAEALFYAGAKQFVIDVAHAAALHVVQQYDELRKIVKSDTSIIIGNVATARDVNDFLYHSKSSQMPTTFKVGIGGGSMCTTRIITGCGMPTLQSVMDCYRYTSELGINIIADGGIKNSGDIVKALAAGADAVMVGSLLSGTEETPGELVAYSDPYGGGFRKKYRGSASLESYEVQGKVSQHRTAEGESTYVQYKGSAGGVLQSLSAGIKSGLAYVGASNLTMLKQNARFIRISNNGLIESKPHGKN